MTMNRDKVVAQLKSDLEAARGFERNVHKLLDTMRRPMMDADLDAEARGIRYNQHFVSLYLSRASAVLEAIGECRNGDVTTTDDLEGFIHGLMCDFPED